MNVGFYSEDRLVKGFNWENEGWYNLDIFNISYSSNPHDFNSWKKTTKTDYDILAFDSNDEPLRSEFKWLGGMLHPAWLKWGWTNRETDCYVVNDKNLIPKSFFNWCRLHNKKVFTIKEWLEHLLGFSFDSLPVNDPNTSLDVFNVFVSELVTTDVTFNDTVSSTQLPVDNT